MIQLITRRGLFSLISIATLLSVFASPSASIPFSHLGAEADKKVAAQGVTVTAEGLKLCAPMQKLEAYVAPKGATIRSVSESEGKGDFSISPVTLGRGLRTSAVPAIGTVSSQDEHSVLLDREIVIEQFSASSDGIRQDFIITKKPSGKGALSLLLNVKGAKATSERSGVAIAIPAGRKFVYGNLKATDAKGTTLSARMEAMNGGSLRISVEDVGAKYPVTIDPTIADADWVAMNNDGVKGINGVVYASVYSKGIYYFGGQFTTAGHVPVGNIARWNGSKWDSLGSGTNDLVLALSVDKHGNLYAGGYFTLAGGLKVRQIAKWNGNSWETLGSGIGATSVTAIACDDSGNVYAGGSFQYAGAVEVHNVAKWNGIKWSSLGSGVQSNTGWGAIVSSLVCDKKGNVYVGGDLDSADGKPAHKVAKWDGMAWSPLGLGVIKRLYDYRVNTMACDSEGNLYVAGKFDSAGNVHANNIAMWNGNVWASLGVGVNDAVKAVVLDSDGGLFVGGLFTTAGGGTTSHVAKWDGKSWTSLGAGITDGVYFNTLAHGEGKNIVVGGLFTSAGNIPVANISMWDGNNWNALGAGINGRVNVVTCDNSSNVYLGGNFTTIGNCAANHVAKWNGSEWSGLGTGVNGEVYAILLDKTGNVFVGGGFDTAGGIQAKSLAKWDGNGWSPLGSGIVGYVLALTFDKNGYLFAGGTFDLAGGNPVKGIAKWDGNNWSSPGSGDGGAINSFACDDRGNLFAGGTRAYCGKWDGIAWETLAEMNNNGGIQALAYDGKGNLYAGGTFDSIGKVAIKNLAKWNGSQWCLVGSNFSKPISSLACDYFGNLYIGVYSGVSVSSGRDSGTSEILKWNGAKWDTIGFGSDERILSLTLHDSVLYAGGAFSGISSIFSPSIIKCNLHGLSNSPIVKGSTTISMLKSPRYHIVNSNLLLFNIIMSDRISLNTPSGRCIREALGISRINLGGIAPGPLFVRVSRAGKIVSTGMVMVQ